MLIDPISWIVVSLLTSFGLTSNENALSRLGYEVFEPPVTPTALAQGSQLPAYPALDESVGVHFRDPSGLVLPCANGYFCPADPVSDDASLLPPQVSWSTTTRNLKHIDDDHMRALEALALDGAPQPDGLRIVAMRRPRDNTVFVPRIYGTTLAAACQEKRVNGNNWEWMCAQARGEALPNRPLRLAIYRFDNAATSYGEHCGVLFNGTHRVSVEPSMQAHSDVTQRRVRRFHVLGHLASPYCHEGQSHFMFNTAVDLAILLAYLPDTVPLLLPINDKVERWLAVADFPRERVIPFEPDVTYVADHWYAVVRASPHGSEQWGSFSPSHGLFTAPPPASDPAKGAIVLVHRRDRGVRSLTNHAELATALRAANPDREVIEFVGSDVSPADAQRLFGSAAVMVGPHGGAFMNMMFMQKGAGVVEIGYTGFGGMHFPAMFTAMAHGLELDYTVVLAEGSYTSSITCNTAEVVAAVADFLSRRGASHQHLREPRVR